MGHKRFLDGMQRFVFNQSLDGFDMASGSFGDITLASLIKQFHISDDEAHLVLVNGHFVNCGEDRDQRKLTEGDTVSIWPPVAGG